MTDEPIQNKRPGKTINTSVSVSKEFKHIIDKYELSPTDVFRRGLGVTLADLGIEPYVTPLNEERLKAFKIRIKLDRFQDLIKNLEAMTINLKSIINEINDPD
jgi:hypothetical protein